MAATAANDLNPVEEKKGFLLTGEGRGLVVIWSLITFSFGLGLPFGLFVV
jgi:hypothetical protein